MKISTRKFPRAIQFLGGEFRLIILYGFNLVPDWEKPWEQFLTFGFKFYRARVGLQNDFHRWHIKIPRLIAQTVYDPVCDRLWKPTP